MARCDRDGEQGFAALMFVALVGTALILLALSFAETLPATGARRTAEQDRNLARAREAVVAFHHSTEEGWPCPDSDGDGIGDVSCANGKLTAFAAGDLPWLTLSLPRRAAFDVGGAPILYAADPGKAITVDVPGGTETVAYVLVAPGRDGVFSAENGDGDQTFEHRAGGDFDDRLTWQREK